MGKVTKFRYKIDVLKALENVGYTPTRLRHETKIGEKSIQMMRHGDVVGIIQLQHICELLDCQPGDLIEYVKGGC